MPELQRVRYSHDAMIDCIIANPAMSQREIAAIFGRTESWISIVFNSDSFKERLAERKEELVDPALRATFEEKLKALADKSFQVIMDKLQAQPDAGLAVKALDLTTRALGYGAKQPQTQINFQQNVAVVPAKAASTDEWMKTFSPSAAPRVVDIPAGGDEV